MLSLLFSIVPNWPLVLVFIGAASRLLLAPLQRFVFIQQQRLANAKPELDQIPRGDLTAYLQAAKHVKQKHGVKEGWLIVSTFAQLPVFIWLYRAIKTHSALTTATFAWLPSLAKPDPLLILPVLATAIAYTLTRTQKKSTVSPWLQSALTFAFIFAVPSGVAIYSIAAQITQGILQWKFLVKT